MALCRWGFRWLCVGGVLCRWLSPPSLVAVAPLLHHFRRSLPVQCLYTVIKVTYLTHDTTKENNMVEFAAPGKVCAGGVLGLEGLWFEVCLCLSVLSRVCISVSTIQKKNANLCAQRIGLFVWFKKEKNRAPLLHPDMKIMCVSFVFPFFLYFLKAKPLCTKICRFCIFGVQFYLSYIWIDLFMSVHLSLSLSVSLSLSLSLSLSHSFPRSCPTLSLCYNLPDNAAQCMRKEPLKGSWRKGDNSPLWHVIISLPCTLRQMPFLLVIVTEN